MQDGTWNCPNCGEKNPSIDECCWKCGTSNNSYTETSNRGDENDPDRSDDPVEAKLNNIQKRQKEIEEMVKDIQSKVGCIFILVILFALLILLSLLGILF